MNQTIQIINRIIPIIILLLTGKYIQSIKLISERSVQDIKKIVVNLALPAALFSSFLNVDLQAKYVWFLPVIFSYCVLMYLVGTYLHRRLDVQGEYFPFLITGFEYGMTGVSLFGAAYGMEKIGSIAIIDFGQEMFIWFLYMALLMRKQDGTDNPRKMIKMFATSPVIIAIFAGILINLFNLSHTLYLLPITGGILDVIESIGGITIPLILLVVGYGIQLDKEEFNYSARVIFIRLALSIPAALLLNRFFIEGILGLDQSFKAAFFTLLILPPPFILTLYMKQELTDELHSINNTLTLHTIVSIIVFILYYIMNPAI